MGVQTSVLKSWLPGADPNYPYTMDSDIDENNGLILNNVFFPEEMLIQILFYVDHDSLVYKGRRVCKVWRRLIESSVLKSKVDYGPYRSLATVDPVVRYRLHLHWSVYYLICKRDPFDKNLLRNPSGKEKLKHWKITANGGDKWAVEEEPAGGAPLPETDKDSPIFVTSYHECEKQQQISLLEQGFNSIIMDEIRPIISIRELYSARFDCGAVHYIRVTLLDKDKKPMFLLDESEQSTSHSNQTQDSNREPSFLREEGEPSTFQSNRTQLDSDDVRNVLYDRSKLTQFEDIHENMERMMWHEVRHEFKNYPPGVRFIQFCHGGRDTQFWAGHFGAKITGSSVKLLYPAPTEVEECTKVMTDDYTEELAEDDVEDSAL